MTRAITYPEELFTHSVEETENYGAILAQRLSEDSSLPKFIALYGDLGVGKTAFVRGFTSVFAKNARVKSPTFALVNEYKGDGLSVFHFDMYRICDEDELYSIGFYDYQDRNGICLVEWSENIEYALPEQYFSVKIEKTENCEENTELRKITTELIDKK